MTGRGRIVGGLDRDGWGEALRGLGDKATGRELSHAQNVGHAIAELAALTGLTREAVRERLAAHRAPGPRGERCSSCGLADGAHKLSCLYRGPSGARVAVDGDPERRPNLDDATVRASFAHGAAYAFKAAATMLRSLDGKPIDSASLADMLDEGAREFKADAVGYALDHLADTAPGSHSHHDPNRPTHLCDDPGGLVPPDEREDGDA